MRGLIIGLVLFGLVTFSFAEEYTGKAENITATERGVSIEIVIVDSRGQEVYRRQTNISTGTKTPEETEDAIKNIVERTTQEVYAHIEGGKAVEANKTELEAFSYKCKVYVAPDLRPVTRDTRD